MQIELPEYCGLRIWLNMKKDWYINLKLKKF